MNNTPARTMNNIPARTMHNTHAHTMHNTPASMIPMYATCTINNLCEYQPKRYKSGQVNNNSGYCPPELPKVRSKTVSSITKYYCMA
jgi:hypothetical protein